MRTVLLPTLLCFAVLGTVWLANPASAQMREARPVTAEQQAAIVDSIARIVADNYVFPDAGKKMADHIRKQQKQGAYKALGSLPEFTRQLTQDLRSISHDLHLGVHPAQPGNAILQGLDSADTAAEQARMLEEAQRDNFGFVKIERLPGNIGYVKLNMFYPAEIGGATAIAAMNFVGHCDAVIFDLRDNGGGDPSMIQLLTSYLYDKPQFLNMFEVRGQERPDQFWSLAYVPGPRLMDAPVYVLTSKFTFSGAEEFSYNLKNLKRGTIIGETTGGGAHPVNMFTVASLGVSASVPYGRAVNPITNTNWEGKGVEPDLACPAPEALDRAQAEALRTLAGREVNPERKRALEWTQEAVGARLNPIAIPPQELTAYAGVYGPRSITVDNNELFYQRESQPRRRLVPVAKNRFMIEGVDYFRLEFVPDSNGAYREVVGHYDNGTSDRHTRNQ